MQQAKPPSSTMTRGQAAKKIGCSKTRVRQYEQDGRLHAVTIDDKGVHHYARDEVEAFARTRSHASADRVHGTVAAEVFQLFREGVELPEIVMKTQQAPLTIRKLYEEYRRPLGYQPPPKIDLAEYDRSAKELDEKIAALRDRPALTKTSGERPAARTATTPGARHAGDK
jgi:DNA-binding transcriptional MerR regulator